MNLKRLCTTTIGSSAGLAYEAESVTARIHAAVLMNDNASAVTVSIWLPSGGSAGVSNKVLKDKSIAAGGSYVVKELIGHTLEAGFSIQAAASTANVVSLVVSGIEVAVEAETEEEEA